MITEDKVNEYIRFDGDIDGWVRSKTCHDEVLTEDEWSFLDSMVSERTIIRKNLASPEFKDSHEEKIKTQFDCEATYNTLAAYENRIESGSRE
ncbi:hypothetical protein ACFLS1_07770 [Verrucomicrobiota bacterium]